MRKMAGKLCEVAKMTSVRPELFSERRKEQGRQEAVREALLLSRSCLRPPRQTKTGKLVLPLPGSFLVPKFQDAG